MGIDESATQTRAGIADWCKQDSPGLPHRMKQENACVALNTAELNFAV